MPEKKKFKTEVKQLLDLVANALYTNKDIFLRELVANAADAIDKARFESITNSDLAREWEITIEPDKNSGVLTISDNGSGMAKAEVMANIGTIAKSGTKAFIEALEEKGGDNAPELIGQFGVGFYSAFMVADKVVLETKRSGSDEPAVRWTSDGVSSYTLEESDRSEPGTSVTLHLKPDAKGYLEEWRIKDIVKKYSDFIEHPVKLVSKDKKNEDGSTGGVETINSMKAIWLRPPAEVSDDDHANFLAHLDPFGGEPLLKIHFSAEGATEFKALLYVPSKAPLNLFNADRDKKGLHLYIKRVFISDECEELLPPYLRFVRGVVDSSDLPLNVSRETLQDNPILSKINKNLARKVLAELAKLKEKDRGKYAAFHKEFGKVLKEGLHFDFENKDRLLDLVMFETLNRPSEEMATLKEYADAAPSSQKAIYYIVGESREEMEKSPKLEILKANGNDVLLMTDPIDEWVIQAVPEFNGLKLQSVGEDGLELGGDAAKEMAEKAEEAGKKHGKLLEALSKSLDGKVSEVRFSRLLAESACCLVRGQNEMTPRMRRILETMGQAPPPESKPILELNPSHPLLETLESLPEKAFGKEDGEIAEVADSLYCLALIAEGSPLPDPGKFTSNVANLLAQTLEKPPGGK